MDTDILFSKRTYVDRVESVKKNMASRGIGTLILSKSVSVFYLAGFPYMIGGHFYERPYERPLYLIISLEEEPILLTPGMEFEHAKEKSWISDVRLVSNLWSGSLACAFGSVAEILEGFHLEDGKIGVEDTWTSEGLGNFITDKTIVDAEDIVSNMRMVKSEEEIMLITQACRYTDYAIQVLFESAHEGATELELMNKAAFEASQKMIEEVPKLETYDNLVWVKVNSGPKTVFTHGSISNRKLRKGDIVTFITKAFLGFTGYHGHLVRTAFVGKPTKKQKNLYLEALDAEITALDAIGPGVRCCDADREARKKRGGGGGFGMGIESHEDPYLRKSDRREMRAGMVFYIPSGIYIKGHGAYKLSDNVVVTDYGRELLTNYPKDLESMII